MVATMRIRYNSEQDLVSFADYFDTPIVKAAPYKAKIQSKSDCNSLIPVDLITDELLNIVEDNSKSDCNLTLDSTIASALDSGIPVDLITDELLNIVENIGFAIDDRTPVLTGTVCSTGTAGNATPSGSVAPADLAGEDEVSSRLISVCSGLSHSPSELSLVSAKLADDLFGLSMSFDTTVPGQTDEADLDIIDQELSEPELSVMSITDGSPDPDEMAIADALSGIQNGLC